MNEKQAKGGSGGPDEASVKDLGQLYQIVRARVQEVYGQPKPLEAHTLDVLTTLEVLELIDIIKRIGFRMEVVLPPETVRSMQQHLHDLMMIEALRERVERAKAILGTLASPTGRPS